MNAFWTFTHAPSLIPGRSICILQHGANWRSASCNTGSEVVCMQVLLKKEKLL